MKIDDYVKRLLNKDFQNEEDIIENKKYILKISEKCKSTKLFKDNIKNFKDFKKYLKKEASKNNISFIWAAYLHFLNKIVSAPTAIHMRYAPILTIPIIADFIKERKNK